jgi:hypothetical protein
MLSSFELDPLEKRKHEGPEGREEELGSWRTMMRD